MSELLSQIYALLLDVVVPHLNGIQEKQTEQRLETDRLNRTLEQFRAEMQLHFAEIRAEIALCRQELEDTMVTLRESEAGEERAPSRARKKRSIN